MQIDSIASMDEPSNANHLPIGSNGASETPRDRVA